MKQLNPVWNIKSKVQLNNFMNDSFNASIEIAVFKVSDPPVSITIFSFEGRVKNENRADFITEVELMESQAIVMKESLNLQEEVLDLQEGLDI